MARAPRSTTSSMPASTIAGARLPILVFDARPSWNSTFVRRASKTMRGSRSGIAAASRRRCRRARRTDASMRRPSTPSAVVIVGGPDALTAEEAALLERYVRVRGGTLVLLPERPVSGASAQLFPANGAEHLTAERRKRSARCAPPRSCAGATSPVTATVIAQIGIVAGDRQHAERATAGSSCPARWMRGATVDLDSGAFDRFWRSLVAEGAARGRGTAADVRAGIAARGSRARFTVRDRRLEPRAIVEALGGRRLRRRTRDADSRVAGGNARRIRGRSAGGRNRVSARSRRRSTIAGDRLDRDRRSTGARSRARRWRSSSVRRARQAASSRRPVTKQAVARALAGAATMSRVVSVHPMRAAVVDPSVRGCLSVEWWLRRRNGLR